MKRSRLVGDFFVVQLLNFLVKPLWLLVIDREVQNQLPEGMYGDYFSLLSLTLLFSVVLDPGLNNFQASHYAKYPEEWYAGLISSMKSKAWLSLIFVALVVTAAIITGIQGSSFQLFLGVLGLQILSAWILHLRSFLSALQLFRTDGLVAASDKLIAGIALSVILFALPGLGVTIVAFVLIQALAMLVVLVALLVLLLKKAGRENRMSTHQQNLRQMLLKTWPYALLGILMMAYTRTDAVMLRSLHPRGLLEVDVYAMGFRLLDAAIMVPALLAGMLLPIFSAAARSRSQIRGHVSSALAILLFPAIALATLVFLHSGLLGGWLYPDKFNEQAALSMSCLLIAFLPSSLIYIFGTLLTARTQLKMLNLLGACTLVLNIVLNLLLIPNHGASGAAFSTLGTQAFFALGCMFFVRDLGLGSLFLQWLRAHWLLLLLFVAVVLFSPLWLSEIQAFSLTAAIALIGTLYQWSKHAGMISALRNKG